MQGAYGEKVSDLIGSIAEQGEEGQVLLILGEAVQAMGGTAAVFCSFVREDESTESYRFLVACDPVWCSEYQTQNWFAHDPALVYGSSRSEPIRLCDLKVTTKGQREMLDSAARHGFRSGAVFPAPSGGGVSRMGVLTIGSKDSGYLEGDDFNSARLYGRLLAMELNDWWIRKIREHLIATSNLTPEDIALLMYEKRGMKSKNIAKELATSPSSIDSRFQRVNAKLNAASRAESAKIASENGVI